MERRSPVECSSLRVDFRRFFRIALSANCRHSSMPTAACVGSCRRWMLFFHSFYLIIFNFNGVGAFYPPSRIDGKGLTRCFETFGGWLEPHVGHEDHILCDEEDHNCRLLRVAPLLIPFYVLLCLRHFAFLVLIFR